MNTKHHRKITAHERDIIAVWKGSGLSLREIARRLKRSVSSISQELTRNSYHGVYVAIHAEIKTQERIEKARKRYPLKDAQTYAYVLEKLRLGWSPEQIDGRLHQETGERVISYEAIYQFIYSPENKQKRLWEYLPWKRTKRKKKENRGVKRERIPHRVSIHNRPEHVNNRSEFGHWEADTVIGKQQKGIVIHTEVERKTRYIKAVLINSKQATDTIEAQQKLLPNSICKSVTTDNGLEFVLHTKLHEQGIKTYFADSYASWQRGTNEYHNGLLRRYLPKKMSFDGLVQEELDDIVEEINNRPRKVLQYQTPEEVYAKQLGVRIQD